MENKTRAVSWRWRLCFTSWNNLGTPANASTLYCVGVKGQTAGSQLLLGAETGLKHRRNHDVSKQMQLQLQLQLETIRSADSCYLEPPAKPPFPHPEPRILENWKKFRLTKRIKT